MARRGCIISVLVGVAVFLVIGGNILAYFWLQRDTTPSRAVEESLSPQLLSNNTGTPSVDVFTGRLELGQTIGLGISGLAEHLDETDRDAKTLVPFLNGQPLTKLYPSGISRETDFVWFYLERTNDSKDAWLDVLRPRFDSWSVPIRVSAGFEDQAPFPITYRDELRFTIFPWWRLASWLTLLAILAIIIAAYAPELLRDSNGATYSLARTCFVFWTFIIFVSFGFIWSITWDHNTITGSAVLILGIAASTTLGAVLIDAGKEPNEDLVAQQRIDASRRVASMAELKASIDELKTSGDALQAVMSEVKNDVESFAKSTSASPVSADAQALMTRTDEELTRINSLVKRIQASSLVPAPSQNRVQRSLAGLGKFFTDLLKDKNGISLQRFQIFIWTIVLGFIFVVSVITNLAMPTFSETVLLLLGVGSGTYLGLKTQEAPKTQI